MNTPAIKIPKEDADAAYKKYLEASKKSGELYLSSLREVYFHLARGRKVLDIYEVFHQSSLNGQGEPTLAIAPANAKVVTFTKQEKGAGTFVGDTKRSWRATKADVQLPATTWPEWPTQTEWPRIVRRDIQTHVPLVPVEHFPKGTLSNYYILFEVEEWQERIAPVARMGDPYLLKRINSNTFIVMAEWDVTPVEQAVMRGL